MFERILIIRLSALGDVVLATPVARALRKYAPQAQIDWLVESPYVDLLAGNRHLSEVIAYDKQGQHRGASGLLRLREELRQRRYQLVIDLQAKPKTSALARAVGAERVGSLRKRDAGGLLRAALGQDRPLVRAHAVELYLEVLEELGVRSEGHELELPARFRVATKAKAKAIGLAPGARWATKRWPAARFAEVGNELAAKGHPLILIGGPGDVAELDSVRKQLQVAPISDTRHLPISGLVEAIGTLQLLVAADSGPVHIASALGVPVVALFGPTSPVRWAPQGPKQRVISRSLSCSPCSNHGTATCPLGTHACLLEITPAEVAQTAQALLGAST